MSDEKLGRSIKIFILIGAIVIMVLISIGVLVYFKWQPRTEPTSTPISSPSLTTTTSVPAKNNDMTENDTPVKDDTPESSANYDGTYSGGASASYGLTDMTLTVSNNQTSGEGVYVGLYNAVIGVSASGSVNGDGGVSGGLSGSGVVDGVSVSGSGSYSGNISGNTMNVSYTVTGSGGGETETHSGSMVLTKN